MRPNAAVDSPEPRSRKQSIAEHASTSNDRSHASPMTFFLARAADAFDTSNELKATGSSHVSPVRSLKETLDEAWQPQAPITSRFKDEEASNVGRRRSTIKAPTPQKSRRESSIHSTATSLRQEETALTPLLLPSQEMSLPSSPKSTTSRSLHKSDDDSTGDENRSQVIMSSEDEEGDLLSAVQDSVPQLIMPSIKMPSRRPFTQRGKALGRYKIMVAGCKGEFISNLLHNFDSSQTGSGKTSLIKSIVQLCDDIVHVDPLSQPRSLSGTGYGYPAKQSCTEIFASTKSYPSWWSDIDESRVLKRRKSMGDSVLERNMCFVEAGQSSKPEIIIQYMEQQLQRAMTSSSMVSNDLSGLLSGRGGSQVDVVLYLMSKDTLQTDCDRIERVSEICNVIPLIAKADNLSAEDIGQIKKAAAAISTILPSLPAFGSMKGTQMSTTASAPYNVSSANGPDTETMDASLLMSPEYIQPLMPSDLKLLIDQLFDLDVVAYLRHTAAKKLITWHATQPRLMRSPSLSAMSAHQSTLASPLPTSLTNSAILVPMGSDLSLTTSNSYALAKLADHTRREERLAQVRLSKWATDLQTSLQRERERYEKLARGDRAIWLIERMGEEVREGQVLPIDSSQALVKGDTDSYMIAGPTYMMQDPLGLLRWRDTVRTRGWIALQILGSFGVAGGLVFWVAKTCGFTSSLQDWTQQWSAGMFGINT